MNEQLPKSDLAIDGGRCVRTRKFPPWPSLSEDEVEAAAAVLRSGKLNYWTGEEGRRFETEFAAVVGCQYAVAVANGTVALELALYALGIGAGDEVIVPSRVFRRLRHPPSAGCKASVWTASVSQMLTADTIRKVLSPNTKAILAVHLAGWPCDMDPIVELARGMASVIEDCVRAHGATYKGRPVGCLGDAAAFSFCQRRQPCPPAVKAVCLPPITGNFGNGVEF